MGRPRGSSNSMHPSRLLLKQGSTNNMTLMNLNLPALAASQISRSLDEDLESQARASISLFGFGSGENGGVSWSKVNVTANTFELGGMGMGMNMGMGGSNGNSLNSISGQSLLLMERVCPLGTNPFLWNTMQNGEYINANGNSSTSTSSSSDQPTDSDPQGAGGTTAAASGAYDVDGVDMESNGYLYGSKVLQQYLVKGVTLLPATVEEVIELLVCTDGDDMETAMHHLVGVKTAASGVIYRRRKKRLRRRHLPSGSSTSSTGTAGIAAVGRKSLSSTTLSYESDSSSSSSGDDDDDAAENDPDSDTMYGQHGRVSLHTAPPPRRPSSRKSRAFPRESSIAVTASATDDVSISSSSYASFLSETGNRGNLSIKWVVGDRPSRMFSSRVHYCLVDYECIIVNDWDDATTGGDGNTNAPMYVRSLQSCYLPQCQPWIDEFDANRPTDLQPTGFMVREAKHREGFVEVQFVGAILEKAQLPNASRRAKLRSLVARIAKLEEIITSRRLSQSLLAHQPLWVRNRERSNCHCCDAKFNLSRRRHHCRMCGDLCCSDCSPKMDVALPDVGVTSVRVCVSCLRRRRQSTDFVSTSSLSSILAPSFSASTLSMGMASSYPSPNRGPPSISTPPTPPLAPPPPPPPLLSSSSSSSNEYLSSTSYGSLASNYGGILGERKPSSSLTSSVLQRFKSS